LHGAWHLQTACGEENVKRTDFYVMSILGFT
jgi:hypothetical protein